MAGWDQAVATQRLYSDTDATDVLLDDVDSLPLLSDTDVEGWTASVLAKTAAAGAFAQSAGTWEAALTETDPSTAGWAQDATWDAVGQSAEDVIAEATFDQAPGSWLAASSELAVGSGTWEQTATWEAEGEFTPVDVSAEATFEQTAAWEASADVAEVSEDIEASAEWVQAATWAGLASQAGTTPSVGSGMPRLRRGAPKVMVVSRASFGQAPAEWQTYMDVDRSPVDVEDLVLAGVL